MNEATKNLFVKILKIIQKVAHWVKIGLLVSLVFIAIYSIVNAVQGRTELLNILPKTLLVVFVFSFMLNLFEIYLSVVITAFTNGAVANGFGAMGGTMVANSLKRMLDVKKDGETTEADESETDNSEELFDGEDLEEDCSEVKEEIQ